jgi:hypothetical protein
MKSNFLIIVVLSMLFQINLDAQKHDYNWIYGYGDFTNSISDADGLWLDFNGTSTEASVFEKDEFFFLTSLSYSDASGNLQLYSDGCALYDEQGTLLENGYDLHITSFCADINESGSGYAAEQGMIALPSSDEDIISLFYNEEYIADDTLGVNGSRVRVRLLRAIIDLKENVVLSKKEQILDTLAGNILSATKHSNGRDWWILNQDYFTNEYKCILVREGEVLDTVSTFIGNQVLSPDAPQSNFSPDGTMFARFDVLDELELYDFDRNTGRLSNFRLIDVPGTLELPTSGGLSFSSSSRFLYVNDAIGIWQYDLHAADVAASVVQVAEREVFITGQDIFVNGVFTFFYRMALAPDCRIYMSSRSGVDRIYVIMNPELKGVACEVVQNIKIPAWNAGTTPHFPNYRLDNAPFCDDSKDFPSNLVTSVSASTVEPDLPIRIEVFPNPASDYFKVYLKNLTQREVRFVLYDVLGREVLTKDISLVDGATMESIQLEDISDGIYVYILYDGVQILRSDRLIVGR